MISAPVSVVLVLVSLGIWRSHPCFLRSCYSADVKIAVTAVWGIEHLALTGGVQTTVVCAVWALDWKLELPLVDLWQDFWYYSQEVKKQRFPQSVCGFNAGDRKLMHGFYTTVWCHCSLWMEIIIKKKYFLIFLL